MTLLTPEQQREVSRLQGQVDMAAFAVHGVTGRTDHSVAEIVALHPDHELVAKYKQALAARDKFKESLS